MFCWAFDLLLTTLILLGAHQLVASQSNSKGRAFMLAFLPNFNMTTNSSLLVTTDAATTVHIYIAATGNHTRYVISKDSSLHIKLPKEVTVFTNLKIAKNKAVFVYASQPVSVYGITSQFLSSSQAAFLAIPIEKWGQSYIVATYSTLKKRIAEIIILVAENTVFTIYLNSIGSNQCSTQHIDGRQSLSYIFEREDVFRISCVNDLTGSVIKGSHPFGVIAGDQCISNSKRIDSLKPCDQMMEMMIPSTMLGHSYIVSSLVNRRSKLRIVYNYLELKAADIPFNVSFTILSGSNATTSFKNVFFEEVVLEPGTVASVKVESHKSVMVILYSFGPVDSAAMTVVPPVERFDAEYNVFFNRHNFSDRATNGSYYVDVYMPIERMAYNLEGFEVSTINATNFGVLHAKNVNKSIALLSKKTFYSNSNIIVTVSDSLSSMAFLAGMKIDFFTGTDNCSSSPCQNNGYCYAFGNTLRCFCGDQLLGDFCETDIRNSCLSQPCLNGGTCKDEVFDFTCKCPKNFMGKICDSATSQPTPSTSKSASTSKLTSTMKPHKSHERPVCNCTCDSKTVEEITKSKEEIEKELKVDPKTVHKTITKYTSTYDKRPSAAGIGILGIVFVSALFGSIVFLDLLSAVHYILSRCLWKGKKQLKQSKNTAATPFQTHDKLKASHLYKSSSVRKTSTFKDGIVLPRFILDRNGSVVLDKKSSDFRFKRLLWSLKQEMASWEFDTIMDNEVHVDKSSFDLTDTEKTDNIYDEVKLNNSEEIRNSSLDTDIDYKSCENDVCDLSQNPLAGVDNSSINNMVEDNSKTHMSDDNDGMCNYSKNIYSDCDSIEMNNFLQSMSPKDHIIMEKNIQP
uniref:EGF-like domain-containing protein n=1 Tax=Biomphalaria glabrata TaxID=6526 RepID=A0A2C9LX54_BIOGL